MSEAAVETAPRPWSWRALAHGGRLGLGSRTPVVANDLTCASIETLADRLEQAGSDSPAGLAVKAEVWRRQELWRAKHARRAPPVLFSRTRRLISNWVW